MPMATHQEIIAAKADLENRCVIMFHFGQSYKSISETLGLSYPQIGAIRKQCGVSTWQYRHGGGPLGTVVCQRAILTPMDDIKKLAKVLSPKQLPPA